MKAKDPTPVPETPRELCATCSGMRAVPAQCPDRNPGCLVAHYKPCPACNGTGKAPETPREVTPHQDLQLSNCVQFAMKDCPNCAGAGWHTDRDPKYRGWRFCDCAITAFNQTPTPSPPVAARERAHALLGCGKWESCRDAGHPSEQRDVCDRITAELERLDADNARLTLDLVAANGRVEYEALGARNASAHCKEAWAERDDWEGASKLGHEALQTLVDDYNAVVAERDAARKSLAEMTESYRIAINTSAEFVKEIDQLRARLEAPAKDGGK